MNEILQTLCSGAFLALPPAILFIKFRLQKPGWWLVTLIILGLGWLLVFGAFTFNQGHVGDLIARNEALPEGWDSDGARGVAALVFGWLFSLIYALPWLVVYLFFAALRRSRQKSQTT